MKKEEPTKIDGLIDMLLTELETADPESPEYDKVLTHVERLHKLKAGNRPERVSRDTLAMIAGNLAGILMIVAYEQKHVMTSKGFTQIIRPTKT